MKRSLFVKVLKKNLSIRQVLMLRKSVVKTQWLNGYQKLTAAMRLLAYGSPANAQDEILRIAKITALETLKRFCQTIMDVYGY